MILTIISQVKKNSYRPETNETFTEIQEIEIDNFRWDKNHKFSFVRKGYSYCEYLEDNQEILRLTD